MSKQQFLDKLQKQKSQDTKQITLTSKQKKTPKKKLTEQLPPLPTFVLKNQTQISQTLSEDTYMRKALKLILSLNSEMSEDSNSDRQENEEEEVKGDELKLMKKAFTLFINSETAKRDQKEKDSPEEEALTGDDQDTPQWSKMSRAEKQSILQEEWKTTPKRDFILQYLESDPNAPYERRQFINPFRRLSPKLQNLFIKQYLSRPTNYTDLFANWIRNPAISETILQEQEDQDETGDSQPIRLDSKSTQSMVKQELVTNLRNYLEKKGAEIPQDKKTFTSILSSYTSDPEEAQRIYIKVSKNYFNLLEMLSGVKITKYMSPADLCSEIERMEKRYSQKLPKTLLKQIQKMTRKQLIKELETKQEIKTEKLSDTILRLLTMFYKTTDEHKESQMDGEEPKGKISFTQQTQPVDDETKERDHLIFKLSKITSYSKSHWAGWTTEELRQRYQAIEDGDEHWQEFQREATIDALQDITGRSRNWYSVMSTDTLLDELERVQNSKYITQEVPKQVKESSTYTLKCFANFETYKWISGKVQSIWIADPVGTKLSKFTDKGLVNLPSPRIKPYAQNTSLSINGIQFFQADKEFFNLQCNKNSARRIQEGQTLTCYDIYNSPVKFIVGYVISGNTQQLSEYSKKSFKINSETYKNSRFIIQDEEIFGLEVEALKTVYKNREENVTALLKGRVTPHSIEVASRFLSQNLKSIAPQIKDYNQLSPYIQIAINSILKGPDQTTEDLYREVASVIVYLNISDAEIFKKRVKAEYYLPDILMILSPQDKFPEVFDSEHGVSEQTKNNIVSYVMTLSSRTIHDMADFQYRSTNPTLTRPWNPINTPEIERIKYDESVCVNLPDVKNCQRENIVFSTDDNGQTFCFDIDKLADQFNSRNFINPKTGNRFSKDFIRRYTIDYYDYITKETYTFPFERLYKQLKSGDMVNKKTGSQFDPVFVKNIVRGLTFNKSRDLRISKFKRLDYNASRCQNPQDIIDEPIESIIYYIDPKDNKKYCFSIPKLAPIVRDSGVNPYTDRPFSRDFLEHFKNRYNIVLLENGLTREDFADKYGQQYWDNTETKGEQTLRKLWDGTESKKGQTPPKQQLIIPNLWNIIQDSLNKFSKPPTPPPTPQSSQESAISQQQDENDNEDEEDEQDEEDEESEEEEDEQDEEEEESEEEIPKKKKKSPFAMSKKSKYQDEEDEEDEEEELDDEELDDDDEELDDENEDDEDEELDDENEDDDDEEEAFRRYSKKYEDEEEDEDEEEEDYEEDDEEEDMYPKKKSIKKKQEQEDDEQDEQDEEDEEDEDRDQSVFSKSSKAKSPQTPKTPQKSQIEEDEYDSWADPEEPALTHSPTGKDPSTDSQQHALPVKEEIDIPQKTIPCMVCRKDSIFKSFHLDKDTQVLTEIGFCCTDCCGSVDADITQKQLDRREKFEYFAYKTKKDEKTNE